MSDRTKSDTTPVCNLQHEHGDYGPVDYDVYKLKNKIYPNVKVDNWTWGE